MASQVYGPRRSFKAGVDLSTSQFLIVSVTANNTVGLCVSATDRTMVGVLENKPRITDAADVCGRWGGGTMLVRAGGTIAYGDYVTCNASSQAITTTTANNEVLGRAINAAVSGDIVELAPYYGNYSAA